MSAATPTPLSGHTLTPCAGQLLAFGGLVPAASLAAEAAPALPGSQNVRPKTAAVSSKSCLGAGGAILPPTREPKKEGGALLLKGWQEAPKAAAPMPPTYEGEWREDQRCGQGKSVSYGEVYEGGWLQGKRHGHGTCFYPDGEVYVGSWVFGKRQGDGALANWP